jgi:hypothetical protein
MRQAFLARRRAAHDIAMALATSIFNPASNSTGLVSLFGPMP